MIEAPAERLLLARSWSRNRRAIPARWLRIAWLGTLVLLCPAWLATATDASAEGVYSPGGWATLHRGPANRKLVTGVRLGQYDRTWTALEGASVLTAPTTSPDGRVLYATTGRARGSANLHAFSIEGETLWQAEGWTSPESGVDPCAILSSPIVDDAGVVYIGDCNQLFAYRPDGTIAWVAALPEPQAGDWQPSETLPINALTTALFTKEGDVFGVTNFGDVVLFDRKTGQPRLPPTRLPGRLPPEASAVPMPDTVFGDGLIDPQIRTWAWQILLGGSMRSTNTPAMDIGTGRIFVAATSVNEGKGALYGLDLLSAPDGYTLEIAFATDMGLGSGSSPALSPAGDRVYVSDDEGLFYSIDAATGEIHWRVQTRATAAAAAVGANGDIYALQAFGPALIAITRAGEIKWQSELTALAEARLPASWLLGTPAAIGNGNPTVLDDVVLVPVVYGYETQLGRRIPWAVESSLVAVDITTGIGARDVVKLEDDSTGITAVLPGGTIVSSLGTALTSGLAPLVRLQWLLPGDRELLRPRGGLQVSLPAQED
jgi:outer membrane protein assembly factor BamB